MKSYFQSPISLNFLNHTGLKINTPIPRPNIHNTHKKKKYFNVVHLRNTNKKEYLITIPLKQLLWTRSRAKKRKKKKKKEPPQRKRKEKEKERK